MKKIFLLSLTFFLLCATKAQNVNVNPGAGSYATLKAAFDAINAGTHTGSITVDIVNNTTETAIAAAPSMVLNASGTGAASYTTISIKPVGGAWAITGAATAGFPMIDFAGADNVTIDGLNTGGNSLTISNTTVSATSNTGTLRFSGDATGNTIIRSTILGSATMALGTNGGNISFTSGAITTGNDNNTISNCNLGPAGANLPSKVLYFSGSSNTDPGTANSGIIITANNIFDYFAAASASAGIDLNSGTVGTIISDNKFYQTAPRTQTTGAQHSAIRISNTNGNNYQITGNTIGFASSAGTGTYGFVGVSSTSKFLPIDLSVGTTTATSVQGNTIKAIAMSGGSSGTSSSAAFRGIYVGSGLVTVGNVTGNVIGDMATTSSITYTSSSTSASDIIGIYNFGSSNWVTSNNSVGGITVANSSTGASNIYGIRCNTGSAVTWTCTNNIVGGNIANSLQSNSTAAGTVVDGILNSAPIGTFTGNTIRNLTAAGGTGFSTSASVAGMVMATSSANQVLTQNTIYNLNNSNAAAATVVTGIQFTGSTSNTVERNLIYDLTTATNSAIAEVNGIRVSGGTTLYKNNMIRIGIGISNAIGAAATNSSAVGVVGINEALGTDQFFHNSVYISGAPTSGAGASYAFNGTQTTNTRSFRDNIFFNARSNNGATGSNYAIKLNGTTTNPTGLTINNNDYYVNGTGGVFGFYNGADVANLAAWQIAVGQDANSLSADPLFTSATDLHLQATSPVIDQGANVGVTDDFDAQARPYNALYDMGADEYTPGVVAVGVEYFRGSKAGSANFLDWKVNCSSDPSARLILERSADGRNFKSIQDQTVTAARCAQGFSYTDAVPPAGINYYRLKTISPDGSFRYSVIVALINKDKGFELISVAPNPVKANTVLSISTVKAGKMSIAVSDMTGKVVMTQNINVIAGNNPVTMNFATLAAGTYNIKVINADNEVKSTRFVKY